VKPLALSLRNEVFISAFFHGLAGQLKTGLFLEQQKPQYHQEKLVFLL
jgi:hypothetical protein